MEHGKKRTGMKELYKSLFIYMSVQYTGMVVSVQILERVKTKRKKEKKTQTKGKERWRRIGESSFPGNHGLVPSVINGSGSLLHSLSAFE